jgi:galactokinase
VSAHSRGRIAYAPGRVNLIGEHTDYNGGLALPMAIGLGVEVRYEPAEGRRLVVRSELGSAEISPPARSRASAPTWARLASALAEELSAPGGRLEVRSNLPVGVGLSSSAAFGVALALALGAEPLPLEVARLCQRAEHAIGSPVGLMDPLVSMSALAGHALRIDFSTLDTRPVPLATDVEFVVVDSGTPRLLDASPYATRRAECESAASVIGVPLGRATLEDVERIEDPVLRRRARHVVSEVERVDRFVDAMAAGDLAAAGSLMIASHRSLRDDFEVSTDALDRLVEDARVAPGVFGARLTGAGFGGCVVVMCRPGGAGSIGPRRWSASPSAGAWVRELSSRDARR